MQKTNQTKLVILLLAILTVMPFVLGASLTDSLINSTQSNTTINISSTIYFDTLIVENGGIYFENYNFSSVSSITFNVTVQNQTYNNSHMPTFTTNAGFTTNVLDTGFNMTMTSITMPIASIYIDSIAYVSTGCSTTYYPTPSSTSISLTLPCASAGTNTFTITYGAATVTRNSCRSTQGVIFAVFALLTIAGFISIAIILINMFGNEWNMSVIMVGLIGLIGLTVVLFAGYYIIAAVASSIC